MLGLVPLLIALAQAPAHRVEASDLTGRAFWGVGPVGSDQWEPVGGRLHLDVRSTLASPPQAEVTVEVTRGLGRWEIDLARVSARELALDVDTPGPGGLVHAALVLQGLARVTRAGETLPELQPVRVAVLTTGYHADDGSFRTLRGGRTGDLEVLVQVTGPVSDRGGNLELGFDDVEVRIDGTPLPAQSMVDATAAVWPGASKGSGVGGSGPPPAAYGVLGPPTPLSPVQSVTTGLAPAPANSGPAAALPTTPAPGNAGPATPLVEAPGPGNASPASGVPGTPMPGNAAPATPLPASPPPNSAPASPFPQAPSPGNAAPATPLPVAPSPLNAH